MSYCNRLSARARGLSVTIKISHIFHVLSAINTGDMPSLPVIPILCGLTSESLGSGQSRRPSVAIVGILPTNDVVFDFLYSLAPP